MDILQIATPDDAEQIEDIVIETGAGVVEHLLEDLISGLSARSILAAAFMKGEGSYNTDHIIRSLEDDTINRLLFSYHSSEHKVPPLMESLLPAKRLNAVRPVLEKSVEDSLYINTIWLAEDLRGSGDADALMEEAVRRCRNLGLNRMSLFCWNDNERALRFYARHGFTLFEHLSTEVLSLPNHTIGGSILCMQVPGNRP